MDTTSHKTHNNSLVSPTLAMNQKMNALEKEGKKVFRFGFGQSPFPIAKPVVESLKKNAFRKDYLPTAGLDQLRETVAHHFSRRVSVDYQAENVMIGPGSKELIFLAQMIKNTKLLLPSPSWVSYAPQAKILEKQTVWLNTFPEDDFCLTATTLKKYCLSDPDSNKLLVLNYPNNPTGVSYTANELKELAAVARKYKLIILSDEIYGALNFYNNHISIARFFPEGTIITEGLSKWCGAGGWRLGVMLIPDALADWQQQMTSIASETFSCVSTPIQYAAVEAYRSSAEIETYVNNCRQIMKAIALSVKARFDEANIGSPAPNGGFYLFPGFNHYRSQLKNRGIEDSNQLCEKLLEETGVAILTGTAFGHSPEQLTARFAFVDFDGEVALEWVNNYGLDNLNQGFLNSCCPKIGEGVDRMINWIQRR